MRFQHVRYACSVTWPNWLCSASTASSRTSRHLAALVSEDPLLLVGRSGNGKTFLLNTLTEALGLEHRHYNASLIAFDDLVGFPYPDEAHATVRFLETPATVWGAESVLVDEISRCKPEHQNRLFSLVHERRLQGLPSEAPSRWAAMNPCTTRPAGGEDYAGSEPLDPALADRFAVVLVFGDGGAMSDCLLPARRQSLRWMHCELTMASSRKRRWRSGREALRRELEDCPSPDCRLRVRGDDGRAARRRDSVSRLAARASSRGHCWPLRL